MSAVDKGTQEIKEVREQQEKIAVIKAQMEEFDVVTRKNADAIHEFCRGSGMSVIEAGAACDWLVDYIKAGMKVIPDDLT